MSTRVPGFGGVIFSLHRVNKKAPLVLILTNLGSSLDVVISCVCTLNLSSLKENLEKILRGKKVFLLAVLCKRVQDSEKPRIKSLADRGKKSTRLPFSLINGRTPPPPAILLDIYICKGGNRATPQSIRKVRWSFFYQELVTCREVSSLPLLGGLVLYGCCPSHPASGYVSVRGLRGRF